MSDFLNIYKQLNDIKNRLSSILYFEYKGRKYIFLGEDHESKKDDKINKILNTFKEPLMNVIELTILANDRPVSYVYDKIKNGKNFEESYIDRRTVDYIEKNLSINPLKKSNQMKMLLKDFSKENKDKIRLIDTRRQENYPQIQITSTKGKTFLPHAIEHAKISIKKLQNVESNEKVKDYIIERLENIIKTMEKEWKITEDQPPDLQKLTTPYLDVTILLRFLLEPNFDEKYVFGVFGKNHVISFYKEYLPLMKVSNVHYDGEKVMIGGRKSKRVLKKKPKKIIKKVSKKKVSKKKPKKVTKKKPKKKTK